MHHSLDTQLWHASRRGDVNGVVSLLERGANVNSTVDWSISMGWTDSIPLFEAARNGHVECIKALLDSGADVNIKDIDGITSLQGAALHGHDECVKALLGHDADVNVKDTQGHSALDQALRSGPNNVVDAIRNLMSRRSVAQQDGDQRPAQNSIRNLQTEKKKLSTQLAGARSRIDDCEEQLSMSKLRNDEHEAQLAAARSRNDEHKVQLAAARSRMDEHEAQLALAGSRNDEHEVHIGCMTGQGDVLASQDVETLERLLAKVDKECLRKAIFDKCLQRDTQKARDAAAECGVCLSAPKDTCLHPCGHTMCRPCSDLIRHCPICRQQIAERRRVFL